MAHIRCSGLRWIHARYSVDDQISMEELPDYTVDIPVAFLHNTIPAQIAEGLSRIIFKKEVHLHLMILVLIQEHRIHLQSEKRRIIICINTEHIKREPEAHKAFGLSLSIVEVVLQLSWEPPAMSSNSVVMAC